MKVEWGDQYLSFYMTIGAIRANTSPAGSCGRIRVHWGLAVCKAAQFIDASVGFIHGYRSVLCNSLKLVLLSLAVSSTVNKSECTWINQNTQVREGESWSITKLLKVYRELTLLSVTPRLQAAICYPLLQAALTQQPFITLSRTFIPIFF